MIADEDVPRPVVEKLRSRHLDVFYIDEELKNATDREVLEESRDKEVPILTFDSDFEKFDDNCGILHVTQRTEYGIVVEAVLDVMEFVNSDFDSVVKVNPSNYR